MPAESLSPNPFGALTDVAGVRVGHDQLVGNGWLTGCTVVVPPEGTLGGIDIRGGGPATSETDALRPGTVSRRVDAVLLTGGSAFGLPAVAGVQRWCRDVGRGFRIGQGATDVVPIVPALALFDLGRGGGPDAFPDPAMAGRAAGAAAGGPVATGNAGAGTGALLARGSLRGGVGTASATLEGGIVVAALAAVNAAGTPVDPLTGSLIGATAVQDVTLRPRVPSPAEHAAARAASPDPRGAQDPPHNTTLGIVATNADLSSAQVSRLAVAAQAGLARCLHPVHTLVDGDVVVSLATGTHDVAAAASPAGPAWPGAAPLAGELALEAAVATVMAMAVLDAVLCATRLTTPQLDVPAYRDLYPSAIPPAWA